ncbi:hypothetical protein QOT17_023703 [Balamuthia mandrillaris]
MVEFKESLQYHNFFQKIYSDGNKDDLCYGMGMKCPRLPFLFQTIPEKRAFEFLDIFNVTDGSVVPVEQRRKVLVELIYDFANDSMKILAGRQYECLWDGARFSSKSLFYAHIRHAHQDKIQSLLRNLFEDMEQDHLGSFFTKLFYSDLLYPTCSVSPQQQGLCLDFEFPSVLAPDLSKGISKAEKKKKKRKKKRQQQKQKQKGSLSDGTTIHHCSRRASSENFLSQSELLHLERTVFAEMFEDLIEYETSYDDSRGTASVLAMTEPCAIAGLPNEDEETRRKREAAIVAEAQSLATAASQISYHQHEKSTKEKVTISGASSSSASSSSSSSSSATAATIYTVQATKATSNKQPSPPKKGQKGKAKQEQEQQKQQPTAAQQQAQDQSGNATRRQTGAQPQPNKKGSQQTAASSAATKQNAAAVVSQKAKSTTNESAAKEAASISSKGVHQPNQKRAASSHQQQQQLQKRSQQQQRAKPKPAGEQTSSVSNIAATVSAAENQIPAHMRVLLETELAESLVAEVVNDLCHKFANRTIHQERRAQQKRIEEEERKAKEAEEAALAAERERKAKERKLRREIRQEESQKWADHLTDEVVKEECATVVEELLREHYQECDNLRQQKEWQARQQQMMMAQMHQTSQQPSLHQPPQSQQLQHLQSQQFQQQPQQPQQLFMHRPPHYLPHHPQHPTFPSMLPPATLPQSGGYPPQYQFPHFVPQQQQQQQQMHAPPAHITQAVAMGMPPPPFPHMYPFGAASAHMEQASHSLGGMPPPQQLASTGHVHSISTNTGFVSSSPSSSSEFVTSVEYQEASSEPLLLPSMHNLQQQHQQYVSNNDLISGSNRYFNADNGPFVRDYSEESSIVALSQVSPRSRSSSLSATLSPPPASFVPSSISSSGNHLVAPPLTNLPHHSSTGGSVTPSPRQQQPLTSPVMISARIDAAQTEGPVGLFSPSLPSAEGQMMPFSSPSSPTSPSQAESASAANKGMEEKVKSRALKSLPEDFKMNSQRCLIIANLPKDIGRDYVDTFFTTLQCAIVREEGVPKIQLLRGSDHGCCFVEFQTEEDVVRALSLGTMMAKNTVEVYRPVGLQTSESGQRFAFNPQSRNIVLPKEALRALNPVAQEYRPRSGSIVSPRSLLSSTSSPSSPTASPSPNSSITSIAAAVAAVTATSPTLPSLPASSSSPSASSPAISPLPASPATLLSPALLSSPSASSSFSSFAELQKQQRRMGGIAMLDTENDTIISPSPSRNSSFGTPGKPPISSSSSSSSSSASPDALVRPLQQLAADRIVPSSTGPIGHLEKDLSARRRGSVGHGSPPPGFESIMSPVGGSNVPISSTSPSGEQPLFPTSRPLRGGASPTQQQQEEDRLLVNSLFGGTAFGGPSMSDSSFVAAASSFSSAFGASSPSFFPVLPEDTNSSSLQFMMGMGGGGGSQEEEHDANDEEEDLGEEVWFHHANASYLDSFS